MKAIRQTKDDVLRSRARELVTEKGLRLSVFANGHAHVTGDGIDLHLIDLKYLSPNDIDSNYVQTYR